MKVLSGTSLSLLHCLQLANLATFWCYVNQQNGSGSLLPTSLLFPPSVSHTLFLLLFCFPHIFPLSILPVRVSVWCRFMFWETSTFCLRNPGQICVGDAQCLFFFFFSSNTDNCLPSIANMIKINWLFPPVSSISPPPPFSVFHFYFYSS